MEKTVVCRSHTPKPVLVVGNAGEGTDLPLDKLLNHLQPLGAISAEPHGRPGVPVVFVQFANAQAAAAARDKLVNGYASTFTDRVLELRYGEYIRKRVRRAVEDGNPTDLLHDFVTPDEEALLLQCIDNHAWDEARVVEDSASVLLPEAFTPLVERVTNASLLSKVDQVTVNEYTPGVGMTAHVDTHSSFQECILALSLQGHMVMEFRRTGHTPRALYLPPRSLLVMADEARYGWFHYIPHRKSDKVNGQHLPRPLRRVSITMRNVRPVTSPCTCAYADMCDSQGGGMPPTRLALLQQEQQGNDDDDDSVGGEDQGSSEGVHEKQQLENRGEQQATEETRQQNGVQTHETNNEAHKDDDDDDDDAGPTPSVPDISTTAAALEAAHVHTVYDAIAGHFSATRFAVWHNVKEFLQTLQPGCLLADIGCGNGKYFYVRNDIAILGSDRSPALAAVAARRLATPPGQGGPPIRAHADVAVADALHLPYRDGCADAAVCIAVLHHMSTDARRLQLLREVRRVLRHGGRALVTVWALEQEDPGLLDKWTPLHDALPQGPNTPSTQTTCRDYFVPWHVPMHRADAPAALAVGRETHTRVDGRKHAVVLQRYYHLFGKGELGALVERVGGLQVVHELYDKSNWGVEVVRR